MTMGAAVAMQPDQPAPFTFADLRLIEMAKGNFPEVMDEEEAALFLRRSPSWLSRSDVPRSRPPGRGAGKHTPALYLKSQLIAYLENHLTHRADTPVKVRK